MALDVEPAALAEVSPAAANKAVPLFSRSVVDQPGGQDDRVEPIGNIKRSDVRPDRGSIGWNGLKHVFRVVDGGHLHPAAQEIVRALAGPATELENARPGTKIAGGHVQLTMVLGAPIKLYRTTVFGLSSGTGANELIHRCWATVWL